MKKVKVLFMSLGMVALFSLGACKKEESVKSLSCADAATAVSNAATTYGTSPTIANCNAFKSALKNALSACKTAYTQGQIDDLQAEVDAIECVD